MPPKAPKAPPKDPLKLWPDEWEPLLDNIPWRDALGWSDVAGFKGDLKTQTGFEGFAMNYAFNYCFEHIPSRVDPRDQSTRLASCSTSGPQQLAWNDMLQFYRGHIVSVIKNGRAALDTRWRGSYQLLCAVIRLVIHMCALEERMLGPRYDVFGPWPVCPNHIVRRYM